MISTALVLLMVPGVGFFYSGLARRKSALSLIWLSMMATAVVSFQVRSFLNLSRMCPWFPLANSNRAGALQWFFWGYSLAFSHTAGKFLGNLDNIGFKDVLGGPSVVSPKVPDLLFAVFQGMFSCIT